MTIEEPRNRTARAGCSPLAWIDAHFGEMIAVLAALVTILAAVVASLESWASNRYDADIRLSQALAMDALGHDVSSRQRESHDFYLYSTWYEWDWRRFEADLDDDEVLAERSRHMVDLIASLTPLLDENQPYFDPEIGYADIYAYHVDTNLVETTELLEKRGFAIQRAQAWNGKADRFVTILTLLSVALFLYGLSTVIKSRLRYLFTVAGSFLVGVALLWTMILALLPVPTVSDAAIAEYARGVGRFYLSDYEGAVEAFGAALEAAPRYGNAYYQQGKANLRAESYAAAVESFRQAIRNGHESPSAYWEMGWAHYLLGDYESSLEASRRALELDPDLLPVVMNIGTALLVQGETDAAMAQYEKGLVMAADASSPVPVSWRHLYLRLTVVDLDKLIAVLDGQTGFDQEPDLSGVADRAALRAAADAARLYVKEGLVAIEAAGTPQMERTGATLSPIAFGRYVGQSGELVGQGDGFARGALSVVAALSYDDLPQGAIVSRRVTRQWADDPATVEALPTMGADITWSGGAQGTMQHVLQAPWPGDTGLRPGRYVVEYYVNGYLLQTGSFAIPDEYTPLVGPIAFATEHTSRGVADDPAKLFPAGVKEVYALFSFSGLDSDSKFLVEWYRDDTLMSQQTYAFGAWDFETSSPNTVLPGNWRYGFTTWGFGALSLSDILVIPGNWRLDLYLEGQDTVTQSASFEVAWVSDYLEAIGEEPETPLFHANLGDAYARARDYEEATARYGKAVDLDPQCAECYHRWWSFLYNLGEYEEAAEKLQQAIELRPDDYGYLCDLGATYYRTGDGASGGSWYLDAIPANPAYAYNRWASTLNDLGLYEEAVSKGEVAFELDPVDPASSFNLGVAYHGLGDYDRAITELKLAVAADPEYHEAYNEWGGILYDQEMYAEAAEKYLKASELAPFKYRYHSNLGRANFMLGQYEDAVDEFMVATLLGLDPSDFDNWGRALYELGRFDEAAEKHAWAVELDPHNPFYHYNLGWTYYQLRDTERAIAEFEKAAELAASQGYEALQQLAEEALAVLR